MAGFYCTVLIQSNSDVLLECGFNAFLRSLRDTTHVTMICIREMTES